MTRTKQTAKKTTGGTAPRRKIPSHSQRSSLDAAHDKVVKRNSIRVPPRKRPTDSEAGVAEQTMAVSAGREALVSLRLAQGCHCAY